MSLDGNNNGIFFLWIFFILAHVTAIGIIGAKEVHIEKLAQCDDVISTVECDDVISTVELVSALLNYQKFTMTVNTQFNVKSPVGADFELIKCQVKGEPDTCEFNSRYYLLLDCQQLHDKHKMWSEFVEHIPDLPDQCPVTPAVYNVTDATVSLKNIDRLPLGVGYWKITINGLIRKKVNFCIMTELDIQMQRKRKLG